MQTHGHIRCDDVIMCHTHREETKSGWGRQRRCRYEKRQHKPAGDTELARHAVHAAGPVAFLYLPASHAVHVPPLGPVYPALHAQSPLASLAAFSCTQMHTRKFTQADTHASENLCLCVCLCICEYMYVCLYHTYVYLCMYMYVCKCVCECVCV